jgi:hypothetical protein
LLIYLRVSDVTLFILSNFLGADLGSILIILCSQASAKALK